jgi:hypothetical protein
MRRTGMKCPHLIKHAIFLCKAENGCIFEFFPSAGILQKKGAEEFSFLFGIR